MRKPKLCYEFEGKAMLRKNIGLLIYNYCIATMKLCTQMFIGWNLIAAHSWVDMYRKFKTSICFVKAGITFLYYRDI